MNRSDSLTTTSLKQTEGAVTLTNCDREPIHIPGSIQPHGALIVLRESDFVITQVSKNIGNLTHLTAAKMLGQPLVNLIENVDVLRGCLEHNFEQTNPLPIRFCSSSAPQETFNGILHRAPGGEIVLELEPHSPQLQNDFFQFHHQVKGILSKMQMAPTLGDLCNLIVQTVRQLTGFDRVMVYRFGPQGDGTVIAEAKRDDQESFLGLRYPDSDIPQQAKHLYTLNWLRLIPTVDYEPVGLLAAHPADSPPAPLDMSYGTLRSVSPLHLEYLKNMGVGASMSISLIKDRQLWGLIACHHDTAKFVPYELRTVCEFVGQLMSTEIAEKEANEHLDYRLQLKDLQGAFTDRLTGATDFGAALTAAPDQLLRLTQAQGVAICMGDDLTLIGKTPPERVLLPLLAWLRDRFERDLFVTDALPSLYAPAKAHPDTLSGLLALAVSRTRCQYILWFRPEQLATVTWAGNPDKPKRIEADGSISIFPRQSFEAWQEIVRGRSSPWLPCEVAGAVELRQSIVDIVLRQADELANLNTQLTRSNSELDAFAYIASHDLKEPLRGIHNYATFLLGDYGDILPADGSEKLETLVRLTKRMESLIESLLKFSRLGRQELQMQPLNLVPMLQEIRDVFAMNPRWQDCCIQVPETLPVVWGDRVLVEEVLTNLVANAFKYNNQPEKWVKISWQASAPEATDTITITVQDNGIGIRDQHLDSIFRLFKRLHAPKKYGGGTGAGLTIVKKIIERHGGRIWVESVYGEGTTFLFTLPAQAPAVPTSEATDDA